MEKFVSYILILLLEVTLVLNNYQSSVNAVEVLNNRSKQGFDYFYINPFKDDKNDKDITQYAGIYTETREVSQTSEGEVIRTQRVNKKVNNNEIVRAVNIITDDSDEEEALSVTVPTGLRTIETDNFIVLLWDSAANAERYELEFDGEVIDCGNQNLFIQSDINDSKLHKYRVRAINSKYTSEWSEYVEASKDSGIFDAPRNIATLPTGDCIVICWNSIINANSYEIEIDGEIVNNDISTSYIHRCLKPNTTHTYRVRAKQGNEYTKWSAPVKATSLEQISIKPPVISNEEQIKDITTVNKTVDKKKMI